MPVTEQKELSKNQALTTREKEIFDFIRKKIWNEGLPPTVREICRGSQPSLPIYSSWLSFPTGRNGSHSQKFFPRPLH